MCNGSITVTSRYGLKLAILVFSVQLGIIMEKSSAPFSLGGELFETVFQSHEMSFFKNEQIKMILAD